MSSNWMFSENPHWRGALVARTNSITTLTSITLLSRRPNIMKKLQAEVDEAMTDSGVLPVLPVQQLFTNTLTHSLQCNLPVMTHIVLKLNFLHFKSSLIHCRSKSF